MTSIFYLFGLFQIIYQLYYFIRNIKRDESSVDIVDLNLNVGEFKFSGKDKDMLKESDWHSIVYVILHIGWMVGGLWMDEKFLFAFLLIFDISTGVLPAFKVIHLSSKAIKLNNFIMILITASICYLHYFSN